MAVLDFFRVILTVFLRVLSFFSGHYLEAAGGRSSSTQVGSSDLGKEQQGADRSSEHRRAVWALFPRVYAPQTQHQHR